MEGIFLRLKRSQLKNHHKYLIIISFQKIIKHHILSKNQSYKLSNQIKFIQNKYKLKYYFKLLKELQHEFKERSYEKSALAYYQVNYFSPVIKSTTKLIGIVNDIPNVVRSGPSKTTLWAQQ